MGPKKTANVPEETSTVIYPIQFVSVGKLQDMPAPLVRVSTCGGIQLEALREVISTDPPQGRYQVVTLESRPKGSSTALTLLKVLTSLPEHYASKDWLTEHLPRTRSTADELDEDELGQQGLTRVDNVVSLLRNLLCPSGIDGEEVLRKVLVGYVRNHRDSGPGYRLATDPLVWLDVEAMAASVKHAMRLEQEENESGLSWEQAYALASKGAYLPDEAYSDWARDTRLRVEGYMRQAVHALRRLYLSRKSEAGEELTIAILRSYWHTHLTDEEILRSLLELLGQRGHLHEAEEYYQRLCQELALEGDTPNPRTQETIQNVRAGRHQQKQDVSDRHKAAPLLSTLSLSPLAQKEDMFAPFQAASIQTFLERDYHSLKMPDNPLEELSSVYTHLFNFSEIFPESPFLELQKKLAQEVNNLDSSNKNRGGYLLSRREAFLAIAALALPMVVPSQKRLTSLNIEEILSSLATSIHACWQLSNEFDISAVHSALSLHIPLLVSIVRQVPSYRKTAAHLAAQAFLLTAIIGRHLANLQAAEASCKEAVIYSEIAEDPILHLATLRHLAMIYFYAKRHKQELALYQHMESLLSLETISPVMQSFVYAGRAGAQAMSGLQHEARTSLALARKAFSQQPDSETCPLYIDYDYSQLFISEGLTYYDLGYYKEALESFLQVDGLSPKIPVAERGRLEFLNCQALTILRLPHRNREMQQCINYWTAGIQGAMTLKSRQRYDEARHVYELMTFVWPHEKKIKELRDIIEQ